MRIEQRRWSIGTGWTTERTTLRQDDKVNLVFVFFSPSCIQYQEIFESISERYPAAHIVGGSSAGNIMGEISSENDIVVTAIVFDKSRVEVRVLPASNMGGGGAKVTAAAKELLADDLTHIFVLSDGLTVNGSEVAKAVNIDRSIPVLGGLLGDDMNFEKTYVIANGLPQSDQIVLIGFYGKTLKVGYGCYSGWDEFGLDRVITKSKGNVVYSIDDQPALELYKSYLGGFTDDLPASGLRFPLSIKSEDGLPLIRTLLAIDEDEQSLTFAGDVPEGCITSLMKGNADQIMDGAVVAAQQACLDSEEDGLAVIVSCVGRKLLMDQLADEELELVRENLGANLDMIGFYSYGELAPFNSEFWHCQLHNQTMTLFSMREG